MSLLGRFAQVGAGTRIKVIVTLAFAIVFAFAGRGPRYEDRNDMLGKSILLSAAVIVLSCISSSPVVSVTAIVAFSVLLHTSFIWGWVLGDFTLWEAGPSLLFTIPLVLLSGAGALFITLMVRALFKRGHGPPGQCQSCGYDLTGNMSGVCPECGLAVSSSDQKG